MPLLTPASTQFEQRRLRILAGASRVNLCFLAAGTLGFWAWDYWLDPSGAQQTFWVRLASALLVGSSVLWIRRVPIRWIPFVHTANILVCFAALTYGVNQLEQGVLFGTAGICVFLTVLAFYPIPLWLYLVAAAIGAVITFVVSQNVEQRALINLAIYYTLFTWIGTTALLMLRRQQWKVFQLEMRHIEEARTDPLTGLYNRRLIYELGPKQLDLARRQDLPLVIVVIDIDRFKSVNDRHGHEVGDVVLRAVSDALRKTLRGCDVIGRVGGEEFAGLLVDSTVDDAKHIADRLLESVRALRFAEHPHLRVTVSIGLSCSAEPGETFQTLLRDADRAMLRAKQEGRNCYRIADPGVDRTGP